ncbi:MAG: DUF1343 domain-containing protein [Acidobacteria bacterium]|nr:DUF1343 domain-containing protein [Acidobacteriota bacterium]MBI3424871.1 DUF1343 domain-containing protein [Acidobacteriota bacterium]
MFRIASSLSAVALSTLLIVQMTFAQNTIPLPTADPSAVGMSAQHLAYIDQAVTAEIARKQLPGAVVLVGRQGKVVWRKAYGNRALEPAPEVMTADTMFDLASLTKIVATATSVMLLVERGMVRLGDPVARYIPEFAANGKQNITVEQLLIHRSGLIADNDIKDYEQGPAQAMLNIWKLAPLNAPGTKFIYSDVNFITLAELVKRVSGKPVDQFAAENIYHPLGMKDTGFNPAASLRPRIAPTEKRGGNVIVPSTGEKTAGDERWMRGEVHDPRSYLLGGVAGHAGLFSTADDLAIYCQMMLNRGEYQGQRILSPLTVARMTQPRDSGGNGGEGQWRALGWDYYSSFSANRGDLFPVGSFGHTGFTGTGLWLDPASETFVVFLSNRVHPRLDADVNKRADVSSLRARVASIVAASILNPPDNTIDIDRQIRERGRQRLSVLGGPSWFGSRFFGVPLSDSNTLNGIDVLEKNSFTQLKGKRIGLITNHTGRDRDGNSTIDLLANAPGVKLVALFSPEHGIRGVMDEKVTDSKDEKTGLPIYSLYGETRKPTPQMLQGLDALVFDIQDIGARFYTYPSTMGLAMEAAAQQKLKFIVLDRLNPINGVDVEGPLADADKLSFIAHHTLPIRHGMTVGELAQLFNQEKNINADLQIIRVENWRREQWFDETGLSWVNPSPNMRSLTQATLYPGVCLLEPTNVSVGRGTNTPFELIGAPWIDGRKLAAALNAANLPGVRFVPLRFKPTASVHKDADCGGINLIITNREVFEPVLTGLELIAQLHKLYPREFELNKVLRLLVNQQALDALAKGSDGRALKQVYERDLESFRALRARYLLY